MKRFRVQWSDAGWLILICALCLWIANRLDAFQVWTTQTLSDGSQHKIPFTFAAVDHPFHATRAETLRQSLADGQILRWVANHQGGYPVEFYPLGAPWLEVMTWGATLAQFPLMYIHKVVVIGVFFLPIAGFVLLARADRLSLGIAFVAGAFQVSIRGWWWSGGYMELIEWGLLANVAAASLMVLVLPLLAKGVWAKNQRLLAAAAIVIAAALYTNVRALFPIVAIGLGILISARIQPGSRWLSASGIAEMSIAAVLAVLLTAPLLIALIRFRDLYYFVPYSGYQRAADYLDSSVTAVGLPAFVLAVIGVVVAFVQVNDRFARTAALTLVIYVLGTLILGLDTIPGLRIEQLEATRLMPFQRYLTLYLAAYGVWTLVVRIAHRLRLPRSFREVSLVLVAALVLLLYIGGVAGLVPESDRAVAAPLTTDHASLAELENAVELADDSSAEGTAIMILGSAISWHDQLWGPQWSTRPFFYDDWLWYWQKDHYGDYDPDTSHAYDSDASTLEREYLDTHGIGSVVVTGEARIAAGNSSLLSPLAHYQTYDVYLVRTPITIATSDQQPFSKPLTIGNEEIDAEFSTAATDFRVRRNWFPRWSGGASIEKRPDGYMDITTSEPATSLVVRYDVDHWDWLARILLIAGVVSTLALLIGYDHGLPIPREPPEHR